MSDSTKLKMAQRMQNSSPVGSAHRSLNSAPRWFEPTLHFKGFAGERLRRRCAYKHRNNRRETAGWDRIDLKRCLFFVEMAWAGSAMTLPACRQRPRTVEVMAGCRIQCAWDSFPQREHRYRSELHRSGCGGSTPPSRRGLCRQPSRVANFYSEVPALNRRELGAIPRRPTISASVLKL